MWRNAAPSIVVTGLGSRLEERQGVEVLADLVLRATPQLVICDNNIDRVSGIDLAVELRRRGFHGVLVLHTACSDEQRLLIESRHADVLDGVALKRPNSFADMLAIFSRVVESARVTWAFCEEVVSDVGMMSALFDTRDFAAVRRVADTLASRCAQFPEARLLVQMVEGMLLDPNESSMCALSKTAGQMRFFRAHRAVKSVAWGDAF